MLGAMRLLTILALPIAFTFLAAACSSENSNNPNPNPDEEDGGPEEDGKTPEETGADLKPTADAKVTDCKRALSAPATGTCTQTKAGTAGRIFQGNVLLPDETLHGGEVLVDANGAITCAACDCSTAAGYDDAAVIACANGVISPALINPHDHISYANNPPLGHGTERYAHRHEWRKGLNGHKAITTKSGASQNVVRFAELRFVMGGAVSTAGAGGTKGLLRNVDDDDTSLLEGLPMQSADSDTFPLGDSSGKMNTSGCDYGTRTSSAKVKGLDGYLPHISEGIGEEAHNELVCSSTEDPATNKIDLVQKQTAIIHAVGVGAGDVDALRKDQTGIIWSPRSNIDLYGNTAPVSLFSAAGLQIALGTDWIPSGSMNLLRELKCADGFNKDHLSKHFSDTDLWRMVTINAAYAVGAKNVIGQLRPGFVADISIFDGKDRKDHRAIIDGGVEDVALVLRSGVPLYGDSALMDELGQTDCEEIPDGVCTQAKKACVMRETGTPIATVKAAGDAVYPLFFCRADVPTDEPSCVPFRETYADGITKDDTDGDGVENDKDNCPGFFNPVRPMDGNKQADKDGDGVGDVCDRCPNDKTNKCTSASGNDLDGDGITNGEDNCPEDANADQADADKDGKGDLCDSCAIANPGATPCTSTVKAVRDPSDAAHPKTGTTVALTGLYVTAISPNPYTGNFRQIFAQVGTDPFSGITISTGAAATTAVVGNKISVKGVYSEAFGLSTISAPVITIDDAGTTLPFAAISLQPADLATGAAKAEQFESMLVEVSGALSIVNDIPDGATNKFYEFTIQGGLRIGDEIFTLYGTPANGAYPPPPYVNGKTFTKITGIEGFSFSNAKLWPRSAADFQ